MIIGVKILFFQSESNHNWQWQEWNGLSYLTCDLFKNWQHGFFTRQFYGKSPDKLVEVLNPNAEAYRVKQVHGNVMLTPSQVEVSINEQNEKSFSEADGLISDDSQQGLWVASADCTPVLIADNRTGRVSAIHSGWRGTAKQIVPNAIAKLLQMGSQLEDLIFALGPAISGEVYQVDEDVAIAVGKSVLINENNHGDKYLLELLKNIKIKPVLDDPSPKKVKLDVRKIIFLQLEKQGISKEKIIISPECTYQKPDHFFSYRRNKEKKVQWSGIVSN